MTVMATYTFVSISFIVFLRIDHILFNGEDVGSS